MSAANKRDIKLNTRREILFLEATLHYDSDVFADFTKFSDYFLKISKECTNVIRRPKITAFTIGHYRNVRALGRVSYIDWIENLNIKTEMIMNEKLPDHV